MEGKQRRPIHRERKDPRETGKRDAKEGASISNAVFSLSPPCTTASIVLVGNSSVWPGTLSCVLFSTRHL